jgi:hypothetical protein
VSLDQADPTRIQSPSVEFLDDNTGQGRLKGERQKATLKQIGPLVGLHSEEIDICVEENGHRRYL